MRTFYLASVSAIAVVISSTGAWAAAAAPVATADEVVITAQKRTERLQDVPVAASVVSTGMLAQSNAGDITDLNKIVPSVSLNGTFNGRVPLAMRGISTDSNEQAVGISSGVAIMIDGVPVPSDSFSANQLEDIERVEVLKGPQATLGGRTAAAGVINIVTRGPKDYWMGSASITGTTDKEARGNVFFTGPLAHNIDFSLAAYANHRDFPITNVLSGEKSNQNAYGVRLKLLLKPTENLDITVAGRLSGVDSHGGNLIYTYITPGSTLLFPGSPFTQDLLEPGITVDQNNRSYASPVTQAGSWVYDDDLSLNIDYQLGDLTLSSTTAYQLERQNNVQDLFADAVYFWNILTAGHAPPFYNFQTQRERNSQISEEIKLVSPADRPLSYVIGAFFSDTKIHQTYVRDLIPAAVNVDVTPDTATYDIYGRATWKVLPKTTIVAGLRFNYDVLKYVYTEYAYAPFVITTPFFSQGSDNSSAVVGDISVQQQLGERSMVYATFARGYSPKAYNTAFPLADNSTLTPVKQENINHFELGSKGVYFDRRLTLNLSAFYTIYNDYQIQTFRNDPRFLNPPIDLTNGDADTKGIEVDATLQPTDDLRIGLNAAYIDARFKKYPNAPCFVSQTVAQGCVPGSVAGSFVQNVDGKTMPNSPKFKFTLSAEQRLPLGDLPFDVLLGGDYAFRTKAQMLADQNPQAIQPDFGVLNLHATFRSKSGRFDITAFVNNVTDKHYFVDMEDFWSGVWSNTVNVIGQPARDSDRYAGVRLGAKF